MFQGEYTFPRLVKTEFASTSYIVTTRITNCIGKSGYVGSSSATYKYVVLETNKNKFRFEPKPTKTRSVSRLFRFVSWNQKPKLFLLFRCFEPISKQPKQTEHFRNKPKQIETTLNFLKNTQIYSLLDCLGGSSVCFGSIEKLKLSVRYRSKTTETNCFETNRKNMKKLKKQKKRKKKKITKITEKP
jgi:hypothetical protein